MEDSLNFHTSGLLTDNSNNALILEDNIEDQSLMIKHLTNLGFNAFYTRIPDIACEMFNQREYRIVILHLDGVGTTSLEICQWMRTKSLVPILILTQRDEFIDEQMAISAGATDYVTKPIDLNILTSRIEHQLTRVNRHTSSNTLLNWDVFSMNLAEYTFLVNSKQVNLTLAEFKFLALLITKPHQVFSRKKILDAIGAYSGEGSDHLLDSHASRIRKKVRANGGPEILVAIRSVGFKLAV